VSSGLGLIDDSALTNVYLPQTPDLIFKQASAPPLPDSEAKLKLVIQAMASVHLVAAVEAMSLGAKVGLDTQTLYGIISTAAGASAMFVDLVPQWLSGTWRAGKSVHDVISELVCLTSLSSYTHWLAWKIQGQLLKKVVDKCN